MLQRTLIVGTTFTVAVILGGCQSPIFLKDSPPSEVQPRLDAVVDDAINREVRSFADDPDVDAMRTVSREPSDVVNTLAERREELDALSPAMGDPLAPRDIGTDLLGREQGEVLVNLEQVIAKAIDHNLNLQTARLQPAISAEDVIRAQSIFDYVLFGQIDVTLTDEPSAVPILDGNFLGTPVNRNDNYRFETGVRRRFQTGGELTLSTDLTRFNEKTPGFNRFPDPAYSGAVRLGLTQPLLRGFGRDVNTASIRFAENARDSDVEQLRSDMLELVEQVESTYWRLVLAWRIHEVKRWLVEVGIEVREILDARREFDTRLAEYADAVATVEQRKAEVIRAEREIRAASDALKALLNDVDLALGSEVVLRPTEQFTETPIDYNLRDAILIAIDHRPEVEQSLLRIDDAEVSEIVADNARLPLLNLSAEVAWLGLDDGASDAYGNTFDRDFIDYVLGAFFEYPLGNRGAEAGFRQARLRRSQSMLAYRSTVEQIVLDVKVALRDVLTNYELILAQRSFRVAQAENLRTLEVDEDWVMGLTPEFLDLKFTQQERLAFAREAELLALSDFDSSIAALYRAMGTGLQAHGIEVEVVSDPNDANDLVLPGWRAGVSAD